MGLSRFQQCNPSHRTNFQYCCLKSQKVFCGQCWRSKGHGFQCHSTRCGHFQKLAHLTIDKTLEMKALYYTAQMSSSYEKCEQTFLKFSQLKEYITQSIKQDIVNKLPLFLSAFLIEMLGHKSQNSRSLLYEEATCSEMLKLIKNKDFEKADSLQAAINGYQKINHMYTAMKCNLKQKKFTSEDSSRQQKSQNQGDNLDQIFNFYHTKTLKLINDLKASFKNQIQSKIKETLSQFDSSIEFEGVKFSNKPNFEIFQNYRSRSIVLQTFPELETPQISNLYNGVNLSIETLEQSPQLLLETAKNFLKHKLYNMYAEIKQFKSLFPYKFANIIATTIVPDRQYELTILDLQKAFVKKTNKTEKTQKNIQSSFMNSVNLVIMGPQLIIIQFKNRPKNTAIISIYGAKQQRSKFYQQILEKIGLKKSSQPKKVENRYKFQNQLTPVGLVYAQFQIAYQHLFLDQQINCEFEGEKYAQARGSKLFENISQNYKENAVIDFEIERNYNEIKQLIL